MFSRTFLNISYKVSTKSNITLQRITCHRSLHLSCRNSRKDFIIRTQRNYKLNTSIISSTFIRHASNSVTTKRDNVSSSTQATAEADVVQATDTSQVEDMFATIPDPPMPLPPEVIEAIVGEPTFKSLGLCSWWPSGFIQQFLEYLHVSQGIPWWGTIVITTVCIRLMFFPLAIKIQKFSARMHNLQPKLQYYTEAITEARNQGDSIEAARISHEQYIFMKEHAVNPLSNMGFFAVQGFTFASMFWAIRGMVQAPVLSMKQGGLWWFTDLTVADPYYALPLLTSFTLFCTIQLGSDFVRIQSLGMARHVLRIMPFFMFPIIMNFEGGILCYWVSTNFFSLCQVGVLKIPRVRLFFGIPQQKKHDKKALPLSSKSFTKGFKDSWSNWRMQREVAQRTMYDEQFFHKAGRGPVPKTYKYNPTLQQPANMMLSKKRD